MQSVEAEVWRVHADEDSLTFSQDALTVALHGQGSDPRWTIHYQTQDETLIWRQSGPVAVQQESSGVWVALQSIGDYSVEQDTLCFFGSLKNRAGVEIRIARTASNTCQIDIAPVGNGTGVRVPFAITPDEQFFGGGERFTQMGMRAERVRFSIEDHSVSLYENNSYFPIPFAISSEGYGLWVESDFPSTIDFGATTPDQAMLEIESSTLRFNLYFGPNPFEIIHAFVDQAGHPLDPPLWNWGFWHVSLGGEKAVLEEARKLRELEIPCTALWVYDAHDPVGSIGWPINAMHHSGDYPDIRRLVRTLHEMGYKVQTYFFPIFYQESARFKEIEPKGYLLRNPDGSTYIFDMWSVDGTRGIKKPAGIFDFTNPEAVAWWHELIRYIVEEIGFDGWMHDYGEYTPTEAVAFDGRTGQELHNAYPVLCHKATREACDKLNKEVSFYARSGFTGSQRWLTAAWNGDQVVSWEPRSGYPCCITASLSLSMSGMPYIGPDIGGYIGRLPEYPADTDSKELWIRWTQFSAFTTIMRDHLGDNPPGSVDMWTDEETLGAIRTYSRLHTALTPYWQIYAQKASLTGAPILRHLFLLEPKNPLVWDRHDQYMVGDDILVAPVVQDGVRSRELYLPAGEWLSYWDNTLYRGGDVVTVPAPLEEIPLLMRSGALIPFLLEPGDTLAPSSDPGTESAGEGIEIRHFLPDRWQTSATIGEGKVTLVDGSTVTSMVADGALAYRIEGKTSRPWRVLFPMRGETAQITVEEFSANGHVAPTDYTLADNHFAGYTALEVTGGNIHIMVS